MNLQQLDHLLALAQSGSFSRAAEKVNLTQPALSRSIQMLEQELGLPLVDRVGKRNELTPFGVMVLERAKRISMEAHEVRRSALLFAEGLAGTLHIGLGGAPSAVFSSPLLIHMLRHHPSVRLQLHSGSADVHGAALRTRALDAMVVTYRAVVPREDLSTQVLPTMRSGFVCRRGHPLLALGKAPLRFEDLQRYPVISTGVSDDIARLLVERYGDGADRQRLLHVTCDEISALVEGVRSTDAIFLGVLATMRRLLDSDELVEISLHPSAGLNAQFAFITLKGRTEAPALEIVREFLSGLAQGEAV